MIICLKDVYKRQVFIPFVFNLRTGGFFMFDLLVNAEGGLTTAGYVVKMCIRDSYKTIHAKTVVVLYRVILREFLRPVKLPLSLIHICVMQKIRLVWICFLRRCQGKRSRCIGKKTSGDYTEIKILCLKINRQMQTKNTCLLYTSRCV